MCLQKSSRDDSTTGWSEGRSACCWWCYHCGNRRDRWRSRSIAQWEPPEPSLVSAETRKSAWIVRSYSYTERRSISLDTECQQWNFKRTKIRYLPSRNGSIHRYARCRQVSGNIQSLSRFLPNAAESTEPLCLLMRENVRFEWKADHERILVEIMQLLSNTPSTDILR